MDKASNSYLLAQKLDQQVRTAILVDECKKALSEEPSDPAPQMGGASSAIKSTLENFNWLKGDSDDDGDEYEFESTEEHHATEVTEVEPDESDEVSEIPDDPILEVQKPEFRKNMERIRETFHVQENQGFRLPINISKFPVFSDFMNWIEHTSGTKYTLHPDGRDCYIVRKAIEIKEIPKITVESGNNPSRADKNCRACCTVSEAGQSDESTATTIPESHVEESSSNSKSIAFQLRRGIILPPKRAAVKPKRVTMRTLEIPPEALTRMINNNPNITMPEVLKHIFLQRGTWKLMNNNYKIGEYKVVKD